MHFQQIFFKQKSQNEVINVQKFSKKKDEINEKGGFICDDHRKPNQGVASCYRTV